VLKRGLLCAALAVALVFPALSGAGTSTLVPGVTYERKLMLSAGRPVVLYVVRTPPQGSLYRLRPILSHGTVVGRQTVPSMQARVSTEATTIGVNGDYFNLSSGHSAGVFLRDGVLSARPNDRRSAVALAPDGRLVVDLFGFGGTWRAAGSPQRRLLEMNRPLASAGGVALFTRRWGGPTPRVRGALEVVLTGFPTATLGTDLTGTVAAVVRNGNTAVPPRGAVLQARGKTRATLLAAAPVGTQVTVRLQVEGLPDGALDAIGGGPVLVRDGLPVRQADELFTLGQIARRHPRTAIGQLADGGLLFVVADGRSSWSYGLTMWSLARVMADLGAVTAMGLDGGGSSTISFDGQVLNSPSDGQPRRVANGLFLFYYGIYAPKLGDTILSANGDGVGDSKVLVAKIVRRSEIDLQLLRPDGSLAWRRQEVVEPSWVSRVVSSPAMPEGAWRWVVEATEVGSGETSRMERLFRVNRTLGHLRLSRERMRVTAAKGGRLGASVELTRPARLSAVVLGPDGLVRRVLFRGPARPGRKAWRWNGRASTGKVVVSGRYSIRVTATNGLGAVSLRESVHVVLATPR